MTVPVEVVGVAYPTILQAGIVSSWFQGFGVAGGSAQPRFTG